MSDDVAIKVDHVSKNFSLPHENANSIKSLFTRSYKDASKTRDGQSVEIQHALNDINLEIKKGEFFGIVGRNGSGKSTLLKILANIYQPTKGKVHTNGKLVPFIELGVGFNPELTGRENVYLNGAMLGFSRKEIAAMYDDIVAFAELERFMDQKLKNYSSGMQVRLAFSMATRAEADILLVDEVLAVGDADFQRKCFNHFRKLKKEKKTVVFVSHDMGAVREYCDRAVLIEQNHIVEEGSVNHVANSYTRMFMQANRSERLAGGTEGKRRGTGAALFTSVKPESDKVVGMKSVKIACKLEVKDEGVENLVIGFSVKNDADTQLLGTNTHILQKTVPNVRKGDVISCDWEVPNLFNDGSYFVDVALQNADGETFDWWEEAALFTIYKEEKTPYVTTPDIKVALKKGK